MRADSAEDLGEMIASMKVALWKKLAEMIATELVVIGSAAAAAAGCEIASLTVRYFPAETLVLKSAVVTAAAGRDTAVVGFGTVVVGEQLVAFLAFASEY